MIKIDIDESLNLVHIFPAGALSQADFTVFSDTLNNYLEQHGHPPALLIEPDGIPHWDSLDALMKHVKLVGAFQKVIPKIAIVSDNIALAVLPTLADLFVKAKVRHFSARNLDLAKQWATAEGDDPGSFDVIAGLPGNVVGIRVKGIITSEDYEATLEPLLKATLAEHDKANLLAVFTDEFESYSAGAMWDDARLGFMHFSDFNKIAVVSDSGWIRMSCKFFGPLLPAQLQVFGLAQQDAATDWVKS